MNPNCYTDTEFAGIEADHPFFYLDLPLIQTLINPGSQLYKKIYYEDESYIEFSSQLGVFGLAKIQDDVVETDTTIMPYKQI